MNRVHPCLKPQKCSEARRGPYNCKYCKLNYKTKEVLSRHYKFMHNKEAPYKCRECLASFKSLKKLNSHKSTHKFSTFISKLHQVVEKVDKSKRRNIRLDSSRLKELKCDFCDVTFMTGYEKRIHEETIHDLPKKFKCSRCPESFSFKDFLLSHNEIHF